MAGERGGFVRDAFHQVAVAADRVDVEIEDIEVGLVEVGGEPSPAMAMPTLLPTPWPSGPVVVSTPVREMGFGMAGRAAAELAEAFDFIQRRREIFLDFALALSSCVTPARCSVE